jgi:hypothetical protein
VKQAHALPVSMFRSRSLISLIASLCESRNRWPHDRAGVAPFFVEFITIKMLANAIQVPHATPHPKSRNVACGTLAAHYFEGSKRLEQK